MTDTIYLIFTPPLTPKREILGVQTDRIPKTILNGRQNTSVTDNSEVYIYNINLVFVELFYF